MQRMGARAARRAAAATRRNPLTGLNPLQPMSGATANSAQRRSVAIPLRGSIPCNTGACLGHQLAQRRSRNPLTGLNPLQREEAQGAGVHPHLSQSPYGAQSLATYEAGRPLHPYLSSQSPYGAQSLATPLRVPRVRGRRGSVAIPLRGSIPCNREAIRGVIAKAIEESQSPYGAQSLAT